MSTKFALCVAGNVAADEAYVGFAVMIYGTQLSSG
jgi:hypothetical protein